MNKQRITVNHLVYSWLNSMVNHQQIVVAKLVLSGDIKGSNFCDVPVFTDQWLFTHIYIYVPSKNAHKIKGVYGS